MLIDIRWIINFCTECPMLTWSLCMREASIERRCLCVFYIWCNSVHQRLLTYEIVVDCLCSGVADSIYRDDVVFRDPKNSFQGIKDYKTIFWSLRFHGKLFFKFLYVDVLRIWESPKNPTDAGTILKWASDHDFIPPIFELINSSHEGCLSEVFVSWLTGLVQICWSWNVDQCQQKSHPAMFICLWWTLAAIRMQVQVFPFWLITFIWLPVWGCQLVGGAYARVDFQFHDSSDYLKRHSMANIEQCC